MSDLLLALFRWVLIRWVGVDDFSTWSLVSTLFLALLLLYLLELSHNLLLCLSSVHSLANEDIHQHDLLLLRAHSIKIGLSLPDSLTWLAFNAHVLVYFVGWGAGFLGLADTLLAFWHLVVLVATQAGVLIWLGILVFGLFRSLAGVSTIFMLFLSTWLEAVVDDKCWLVYIKMGRSSWIVKVCLRAHRSFITRYCCVHSIGWALKSLLN